MHTIPNLETAALEYAAAGWEVLPLAGKVPRTEHGHHDASRDPDVIRRWWSMWPAANVAIVVPSTVAVLDLDPRTNPQVAAELAELVGSELKDTLTCRSGRGDGGHHLYYRRPVGLLSRSRLPKGVDLKLNGLMVAPPSLHPDSGQPYRWERASCPIAPMPVRLRELLRPVPRSTVITPDRASVLGLLRVIMEAPEGERNDRLYWCACRLAERGRLEADGDSLLDAAVGVGLTELEAQRTINSARRWAT